MKTQYKPVSLRLRRDVIRQIDRVAEANSRNRTQQVQHMLIQQLHRADSVRTTEGVSS